MSLSARRLTTWTLSRSPDTGTALVGVTRSLLAPSLMAVRRGLGRPLEIGRVPGLAARVPFGELAQELGGLAVAVARCRCGWASRRTSSARSPVPRQSMRRAEVSPTLGRSSRFMPQSSTCCTELMPASASALSPRRSRVAVLSPSTGISCRTRQTSDLDRCGNQQLMTGAVRANAAGPRRGTQKHGHSHGSTGWCPTPAAGTDVQPTTTVT